MINLKKLLLSPHEKILLLNLRYEGQRPRDLMRSTQIAHASLYLACAKLQKRGLAKKIIHQGKVYWLKNELVDEYSTGQGTKVLIHTDSEAVKKSIRQITALRPGERVTVLEGTQKNSGWFELFSKGETIALNSTLSR